MIKSKRRWKLLATASLLLAAAQGAARAQNCAALVHATLTGATVTSAVFVPAGPMKLDGGPGAPPPGGRPSAPPAPLSVPAFCRVKGQAAGAIGFELWLPAKNWNGRLLSLGNGGFGGFIPTGGLADGVIQGYAVTANDTGHQGQDRGWMNDPALVRDWGHSATHLVTGPAKTLVRDFYGNPASYTYFSGCSTGGAQAMEEAEFYPKDYNGIVAGSPGMAYAHLMLSFLWGLKIATAHPDSLLAPAQLRLLHQAVLDQCGSQNGVKDPWVDNPLACHFDVRTLQCPKGEGANCLTADQVQTAILMYQGPRNPRTGAVIYPGFALGSEDGWGGLQGPLARSFAIPLIGSLLYDNPRWDWHSFDWDRDVAELDRRVTPNISAVDPDLRALRAAGGKLIMYQGWSDPLNAQTLPINYRGEVIDVFAKDDGDQAEQKVDDFYRLFMVPGMGHCGGGIAPSKFDSLGALRDWVEQGEAPQRIVATQTSASLGSLPVSRPLCPYPRTAQWSGHADPNNAANFVCAK